MSNIAVTHAPSGLVRAAVVRTERITPHVVRVTVGGPDVARFAFLGFDQWVRLAVPAHADDRFEDLPQTFGMAGYLRYLMLRRGTRPVIRNYTLRQARTDPAEIDIDFVVHGSEGVAGPWSEAAAPGDEVAFIDQGCGFHHRPGRSVLLVADETGMPAVAGILRDLPRDAIGHAIVEVFDERDRQPTEGPEGVTVEWVVRDPGEAPGTAALAALTVAPVDPARVHAFAVGESALATGTRRHLQRERGVAKDDVVFCGYWRRRPTAAA